MSARTRQPAAVPESSVTLGRDNKLSVATNIVLCTATAVGAIWCWTVKARQDAFQLTQAKDREDFTKALEVQRAAFESAAAAQKDAIKEVRDSVDGLATEIQRSQERYVSRDELDLILRLLMPENPPLHAQDAKPK